MTKKRASLKGKGVSILLGEEWSEDPSLLPASADETPPEADEGTPPEVQPPEEEAVDWSAMLEDEAAAAEPPAEEAGPPPLPDIERYYVEEEPIAPEPSAIGEPGSSSPGSVAPPTPVSVAPPAEAEEPEEVDWSAMLEDEAATAEPPAEEEIVTPPVPDIEHHFPEEEPAVPEPELPAFEEPAPPPDTPEAVEPAPSPAADQPPPSGPTTPPSLRIGGLLAGVSLADADKLPPPGPRVEEEKVRETTKAPPKDLTEEEEEIVIGRVSRTKRRELYNRISELYSEVPAKLASAGLRPEREEALLLLSEARDIGLEDPRQFDEAEHKVWQVETIVAQAENVAQWSSYYGKRLIAYLTFWFVALMGAILFYNPIAAWLERITAGAPTQSLPIQLSSLAFTMLWGSLGGVLGGFYSLWKYVAEKQEFDRQYTTWYMLQPISGLLIGAMVHALVMTGFISMFNQVTESGTSLIQGSQPGFWFPALISLALGFRQNFALRFLDRVIELLVEK
jgi:hypothetical protein